MNKEERKERKAFLKKEGRLLKQLSRVVDKSHHIVAYVTREEVETWAGQELTNDQYYSILENAKSEVGIDHDELEMCCAYTLEDEEEEDNEEE